MNYGDLVDVTLGASAPHEEDAVLRSTSRRSLLKRAAAGVGIGALASSVSFTNAFAALPASDTSQTIFDAARTAEELAVTTYYNALHADPTLLPTVFDPSHITYLQGAMWEEKRHRDFFTSLGGVSLALKSPATGALLPRPTFFYPKGMFTDQNVFCVTFEFLETVFINAFNDAAHEWARIGSPAALSAPALLGFPSWRLAKIAAQIEGTECEHKQLVRDIGSTPGSTAFVPACNDTLADLTNADVVVNLGLQSSALNSSAGALVSFVTGLGFDPRPVTLPSDADVMATSTPDIIGRLQNDFPTGEAVA